MSGINIVSKLSEKYPIKYHDGKQLASFIDYLLEILPSMYDYNTTMVEYLTENFENILEIGK